MNSRDWQCTCGHTCFGSKSVCMKCGRQKPVTKRPGDWTCCGQVQFASRKSCMRCGKEKPAEAASGTTVVRRGDWLCKMCNDVQFATRVTCRKCNASKPVADEEADDNACLICMERVRNAALVHGEDMHSVTCLECATALVQAKGECPLCRRIVERVLKTYN